MALCSRSNKFKRQITYKLLDILGLNPVIVYEFNLITLVWTVITNSKLKYSKENLGDLNGACVAWKKAAELGDADAAKWVANQCN